MRILYCVITAVLIITTISCTEQQRVWKFGGEMEVRLPKGEKLIMATWKNLDLFYLTEPMDSGYVPKEKVFRENSAYGVWETEITFVETKQE